MPDPMFAYIFRTWSRNSSQFYAQGVRNFFLVMSKAHFSSWRKRMNTIAERQNSAWVLFICFKIRKEGRNNHVKLCKQFVFIFHFSPFFLVLRESANLTKEVLTNFVTIGPHFSRPDSIARYPVIIPFTLTKSKPPRALLTDISSMGCSRRRIILSLEAPSVGSPLKKFLKGLYYVHFGDKLKSYFQTMTLTFWK